MKKMLGMTLIEILLVLVIASFIIVLGLRLYEQMVFDQNIDDINAKVDTLFSGMSLFYKANCRNLYTQNQLQNPAFENDANYNTNVSYQGKLVGISVTDPFVLDPQIDLYEAGFLNKWPLNPNPLLDTDLPYFIQFNPVLMSRQAFACYLTSCTVPQPVQPTLNQILVWQSQVIIQIANDPDGQLTKAYFPLLTGASCIVSDPTSFVCPSSPPDDPKGWNYILWQRLPSLSSLSTQSGLGLSLSNVDSFILQYTHDPMYELSTETYSQNESSISYYYYCGGGG